MCNEADTFENHDFFRKVTVFEKVSAPFFDPNLHFQKDWVFFSEGIRPSDFFKLKVKVTVCIISFFKSNSLGLRLIIE